MAWLKLAGWEVQWSQTSEDWQSICKGGENIPQYHPKLLMVTFPPNYSRDSNPLFICWWNECAKFSLEFHRVKLNTINVKRKSGVYDHFHDFSLNNSVQGNKCGLPRHEQHGVIIGQGYIAMLRDLWKCIHSYQTMSWNICFKFNRSNLDRFEVNSVYRTLVTYFFFWCAAISYFIFHTLRFHNKLHPSTCHGFVTVLFPPPVIHTL